MAIKCGNCKQYHQSTAEVRQCCSPQISDVQSTAPERAAVGFFGRHTNGATEKQVNFIHSLRQGRGVDSSEPFVGSTRQASAEIERLLKMPKVSYQSPADLEELEDGMYRLYDRIFKVQHAVNGSGRQYAKELVQHDDGWEFEYAAGMVHRLRPRHRMTLDQAKEFGALYGTCIRCGRTLTDEGSIQAGIGPICAGKI